MGMAASQARLLSITSRMADNELRAQIINNSKMRLATESSKVSEEYVSALNSATMMISNYDSEGNSQYQKLTFNALTNYSQHNNQYGLVNANGSLLVSERDADFFKTADGDLDKFLEEYGLKYSSTFFTKDTFGADTVQVQGYNERLNATYNIGTYPAEQLKIMYEGGTYNNVDHLGYDQALQTSQYANYTDYYNQFVLADEYYYLQVQEAINNELFADGKFDTQVSNAQNTTTWGGLQGSVNYVKTQLNTLVAEGKLETGSEYYKELMAMVNGFNAGSQKLSTTVDITQDNTKIYLGPRHDENKTYDLTITKGNGTYTVTAGPTYTDTEEIEDEEGNVTGTLNTTSTVSYYGTTSLTSLEGLTYTVNSRNDQNNETESKTYTYTNWSEDKSTATCTYNASFEEAQGYVLALLAAYENIGPQLNRDKFVTEGSSAEIAKEKYEEALKTLLDFIFGENNRPTGNDGLTIAGNESMLNDPGWIITNFSGKTSQDFRIIEDIYILDALFNVYGEPAFGWIDENNPSENADAKVQWYTNLFNRMQKGFQVLENGLATSNDWIQFALESGLVTMEQVDNTNNWVSITHPNCSDITEVTDSAAVARAEAEYNKAMNNIENKDKRFDIELKNIDTEHNSLQTEYDSVKSVISKNVERSFKLYA